MSKIFIDRDLAERAIEALSASYHPDPDENNQVIEALRASLREPPESEPVAWRIFDPEEQGGYSFRSDEPPQWSRQWSAQYGRRYEALYTRPQLQSKPLADEEM